MSEDSRRVVLLSGELSEHCVAQTFLGKNSVDREFERMSVRAPLKNLMSSEKPISLSKIISLKKDLNTFSVKSIFYTYSSPTTPRLETIETETSRRIVQPREFPTQETRRPDYSQTLN